MGGIERVATWIVIVGLATTLVLSDRITDKVLRAGGDVFTGGLRQAMGQAR